MEKLIQDILEFIKGIMLLLVGFPPWFKWWAIGTITLGAIAITIRFIRRSKR